MAITKASAQTTVNSGTQAAAAATVNQITTAPATATVVAGGGSLGGVTISNVSITDSTFANVLSGDTAVSTAGGFVKITGTGFKTAANVFLGSTVLANTFVSATQINANIPASSAAIYQFTVFNTDGSGAIYSPGLTISGPPSWTTTSYSVNGLNLGNIQLLASGDAPLTYYIQPGSANPQNLAVNSAGYLSGTVAAEGAYTITVIVDDAQNQSTQADITVTVTTSDTYFNLTTLALTADGTNNANNQSFIDSSTNNFTITRNGNATQGSFSPFSQTGWSGYFTGASTSYITTPATSLLDQGQTYTVQCWIYPTTFTTSTSAVRRMYIFIKGVIYAGLSIHSDGTLGWYGWPTPAGMIVTSAAGTITTNVWQHVALVVNPSGNTIKLFKNGVEVGSAAYTAAGAGNAAIQIGHGDTSQGTDGFIGYISNFKVTLSALTGGQLDYSATPTISSPAGAALLVLQTNRFNDTSANAFSITNGGVTSVQVFSPFAPTAQYSAGTNGGSGYFDGTGDSLTIPDASNTALGSGDFTVEIWTNATVVADSRTAFSIGPTTGTIAMALLFNGTTQWRLVAYTPAGSAAFAAVNINISNYPAQFAWAHHAFVRNSGTFYWYINGVQVHSVANSTNFTQTGATIGNWTSTAPWQGYLSNFRIVVGTAVYTSAFTPPTSPLTAIANTSLLLNFTNAGIVDATGKNILETVNQAKLSTAVKKFGSASIILDGVDDYVVMPYSPLFNLGTGAFTIEGWVYFNVLSGNRLIFDTYTSAALGGGYQLYWRSTGTSIALYGNGVVIAQSSFTGHVINTWYHIACTRDTAGNVRIFVDGTKYADTAYTTALNIATTARPAVGIQVATLTNDLDGYIDDFRVTLGYARYTANFTAPTEANKLR
jgi:hypothetical protein